jgi:hypothetical protein
MVVTMVLPQLDGVHAGDAVNVMRDASHAIHRPNARRICPTAFLTRRIDASGVDPQSGEARELERKESESARTAPDN